MHDSLSQDRPAAAPGRRPHPRRVRVAESVYQRVDRESGKRVAGKYEFTYRDAPAGRSRANERELAPTTARMALIALNQVCRYAVRRGWLADNPVAKLEPAERP